MAVDLLALNEELVSPPGLTIEVVGDEKALRDFVRASFTSLGGLDTEEGVCFELFAGLGFEMPLRSYPIAARHVFHDPNAMNIRMDDLMLAHNVAESLQIASECGCSLVNMIFGDSHGDIGWTVAGPLPRRFGDTGGLPVSWADGSNGWDGYLSPQEHPWPAPRKLVHTF